EELGVGELVLHSVAYADRQGGLPDPAHAFQRRQTDAPAVTAQTAHELAYFLLPAHEVAQLSGQLEEPSGRGAGNGRGAAGGRTAGRGRKDGCLLGEARQGNRFQGQRVHRMIGWCRLLPYRAIREQLFRQDRNDAPIDKDGGTGCPSDGILRLTAVQLDG